jgi:hypothetical protein
VLTDEECLQLGNNVNNSLFNLDSSDRLVSYYDGKFINNNELIDLKGKNNGRVFNCTQTITQLASDIDKPIPFRREGKFKVLPHQEHGYKDGYWVSWTSRKNQLKYLNNYYEIKSDYQNDGLTSCRFVILEEDHEDYHYYKVRL